MTVVTLILILEEKKRKKIRLIFSMQWCVQLRRRRGGRAEGQWLWQ